MTRNEILEVAKAKAANLQNNQQIRVTAEEKSYWVFCFAETRYIGYLTSEPMPKFFAGFSEYRLANAKGEVVANLQKLK